MKRLVVGGALAVMLVWACNSGTTDSLLGGSGGSAASGTGAQAGEGGLGLGAGGNGANTGQGGACAVASEALFARPVDVIFAIDQSASMGEEIQGVKDNLNDHLVSILAAANIDYRVVFVAGVDGLPTGSRFFQSHAGVNSSDALTLLLWTYDGFYKAPNTCDKTVDDALRWKNFLRYDAYKVFIVVSDDDPSSFDCAHAAGNCTSTCGGCANQCAGWCPMFQCPTFADAPAAWGGGDFPSELYGLAPDGMFGAPTRPKWMMHAIVPVTQALGPAAPLTPLADVCNQNGNTGETSGVEYQKLARLTGGLRFPSCDTDYSPVFQEIAETIVPLGCKFELEQTGLGQPDPNVTNVVIDYGDGAGAGTVWRDETVPCDAGADGWQYTDGGAAIILCGSACEKLQSAQNPDVQITVGCQALVK